MTMRKGVAACIAFAALFFVGTVFAASTFGSVASNITGTFVYFGKLITAAAYVSGLAFFIGFVMKLKAHKDNPQQVPIGQVGVLLLIAILLTFMPTFIKFGGSTVFKSAETAGSAGTSLSGT